MHSLLAAHLRALPRSLRRALATVVGLCSSAASTHKKGLVAMKQAAGACIDAGCAQSFHLVVLCQKRNSRPAHAAAGLPQIRSYIQNLK
jgi:hypothetical protein